MKSGASSSLAERWTSRRDGEDVMEGVMRNTQRTPTGSLEEKKRIRREKEMEKKRMRGTSLDISRRQSFTKGAEKAKRETGKQKKMT